MTRWQLVSGWDSNPWLSSIVFLSEYINPHLYSKTNQFNTYLYLFDSPASKMNSLSIRGIWVWVPLPSFPHFLFLVDIALLVAWVTSVMKNACALPLVNDSFYFCSLLFPCKMLKYLHGWLCISLFHIQIFCIYIPNWYLLIKPYISHYSPFL